MGLLSHEWRLCYSQVLHAPCAEGGPGGRGERHHARATPFSPAGPSGWMMTLRGLLPLASRNAHELLFTLGDATAGYGAVSFGASGGSRCIDDDDDAGTGMRSALGARRYRDDEIAD